MKEKNRQKFVQILIAFECCRRRQRRKKSAKLQNILNDSSTCSSLFFSIPLSFSLTQTHNSHAAVVLLLCALNVDAKVSLRLSFACIVECKYIPYYSIQCGRCMLYIDIRMPNSRSSLAMLFCYCCCCGFYFCLFNHFCALFSYSTAQPKRIWWTKWNKYSQRPVGCFFYFTISESFQRYKHMSKHIKWNEMRANGFTKSKRSRITYHRHVELFIHCFLSLRLFYPSYPRF